MKFVIYGRTVPNCIYCDKAKETLDSIQYAEYTFIDVTADPRLLDWFKEVDTRHTTFPQVYVEDEKTGTLRYVGGYTELSGFLEENRAAMAAAAMSAIPDGFTL